MYYKRILTFMFPELYSPNEPVYFLGYFPDPHLSMWIRIQDAYLYVDPDPGPKHWYQVSSNMAALAAIFVRIMYIYLKCLLMLIIISGISFMQSCFHADCEQPKWKYCTVCVTMFAQFRKPLKWLNNKQHERKPM